VNDESGRKEFSADVGHHTLHLVDIFSLISLMILDMSETGSGHTIILPSFIFFALILYINPAACI